MKKIQKPIWLPKPVYSVDTKSLEYKRVKRPIWLYVSLSAIIFFILGAALFSSTDIVIYKPKVVDYEEVPIIVDCNLAFSEKSMYDLLVGMNVRFPHIVIAQARIESGHYTSNIFKYNNNMFGMKCARSRATTHRGESSGHAVYDTWQECVIDYAFYQTTYMRKAKTEEQYISALSATYAEDPNYYINVKSKAKKVYKQYNPIIKVP